LYKQDIDFLKREKTEANYDQFLFEELEKVTISQCKIVGLKSLCSSCYLLNVFALGVGLKIHTSTNQYREKRHKK
jgi:hypothetical protein